MPSGPEVRPLGWGLGRFETDPASPCVPFDEFFGKLQVGVHAILQDMTDVTPHSI